MCTHIHTHMTAMNEGEGRLMVVGCTGRREENRGVTGSEVGARFARRRGDGRSSCVTRKTSTTMDRKLKILLSTGLTSLPIIYTYIYLIKYVRTVTVYSRIQYDYTNTVLHTFQCFTGCVFGINFRTMRYDLTAFSRRYREKSLRIVNEHFAKQNY